MEINYIEIILGTAGIVTSIVVGYPALEEWKRKRASKQVQESSNNKSALSKKTLNVGCIPFPPFMNYEFHDGKYHFSGVYYEIFKIISKESDIAMDFVPIQNEESIELLKSKKIDLVACLFKTFARGKLMDFSSCIYTVSVGGVIKQNNTRISVQSDLTQEGIRVAVVDGEVGAEIVKETFGVTKASRRLVEVETHEVGSIISMVENDMVDIAITDNITCKKYLNDKPKLKNSLQHIFIEYPLFLGQVGLMHRTKDLVLSNFLNKNFQSIKKRAEISQIEDNIIKEYDGMITSIFPHS